MLSKKICQQCVHDKRIHHYYGRPSEKVSEELVSAWNSNGVEQCQWEEGVDFPCPGVEMYNFYDWWWWNSLREPPELCSFMLEHRLEIGE